MNYAKFMNRCKLSFKLSGDGRMRLKKHNRLVLSALPLMLDALKGTSLPKSVEFMTLLATQTKQAIHHEIIEGLRGMSVRVCEGWGLFSPLCWPCHLFTRCCSFLDPDHSDPV